MPTFRVAFGGKWQGKFDDLADAVDWAKEVSETGRMTWVVEHRMARLRSRLRAVFPESDVRKRNGCGVSGGWEAASRTLPIRAASGSTRMQSGTQEVEASSIRSRRGLIRRGEITRGELDLTPGLASKPAGCGVGARSSDSSGGAGPRQAEPSAPLAALEHRQRLRSVPC